MTKKQTKQSWKLPPSPTTTLATKPYTPFNGDHGPDCSCNKKTMKFIDGVLRSGFVELPCPFESNPNENHDVVIPGGLDSTNDQERIAALDRYSALKDQLEEAGLFKNADEVHACIHQYLDHGLDGKIFYHPALNEVPISLLTNKQVETHYKKLGRSTQATVKEFIPTLPKNAFITVLTSDKEIKGGVFFVIASRTRAVIIAASAAAFALQGLGTYFIWRVRRATTMPKLVIALMVSGWLVLAWLVYYRAVATV